MITLLIGMYLGIALFVFALCLCFIGTKIIEITLIEIFFNCLFWPIKAPGVYAAVKAHAKKLS